MSNRHYVGRKAASFNEGDALLPFTKVVIIVGEDDNGDQLAYEAGDDTGRTLEVTNPWGTQQMANDMLARIRGYVYRPFEASGAFVPDGAELGDAVTIAGVYSVIAQQDIDFDQISVSDISATGADETDNEFGLYKTKVERDLTRSIKTATTMFTVEFGRIESYVSKNYETKTDANSKKTALETRITQTETSINATITKQISETKQYADNKVETATSSLETKIEAKAGEVLSTVSETYETKDHANSAQISIESYIRQTARDIRFEISGSYADVWESGKTYYKSDVVSFPYAFASGERGFLFYKAKLRHTSSSDNMPPNSTYWESIDQPSVQNMIDLNINGITLSVSSNNGTSVFTLTDDGATLSTRTIDLTVDHANIHGKLTASQIETDQLDVRSALTAGTATIANGLTVSALNALQISANNITAGTLNASQIVLNGYDLSNFTNGPGYVDSWAAGNIADATARTIVANEIQALTISANQITSGTLSSQFITLDSGLMALTNYGTVCGWVGGSMYFESGPGGVLSAPGQNVYVVATDGAAKLSYYNQHQLYVMSGGAHHTVPFIEDSDRRLKDDISYDMEKFDDFFDALCPCTFRVKYAPERLNVGFIAQDVAKAMGTNGIRAADYFIVGNNKEHLGLAYNDFVALCVYEIQKLKKQIKELTA